MWDLWVRDGVRARWYKLLLIHGVSKHITKKKKNIKQLCETDLISQRLISLHFVKELRAHVSFCLLEFKKSGFGSTKISRFNKTLSKKMFKPLMNQGCGSQICRNWENVSWLLVRLWVVFFSLGMNHLLSPGFELTPWESTFGRFFNPNPWVLLAPKYHGNSFRNSGRLETKTEKRSV